MEKLVFDLLKLKNQNKNSCCTLMFNIKNIRIIIALTACELI